MFSEKEIDYISKSEVIDEYISKWLQSYKVPDGKESLNLSLYTEDNKFREFLNPRVKNKTTFWVLNDDQKIKINPGVCPNQYDKIYLSTPISVSCVLFKDGMFMIGSKFSNFLKDNKNVKEFLNFYNDQLFPKQFLKLAYKSSVFQLCLDEFARSVFIKATGKTILTMEHDIRVKNKDSLFFIPKIKARMG